MKPIQQWATKVKNEIKNYYYGSDKNLDLLLAALLCQGHILIEDKPGTGKTLLARALAATLGGDYKSIQCTPDLLPADVLGISIYSEEKERFLFRKGPVVTNLLLVDEINRATPRTQSALLEAMAEGQISIEGKSIPLPDPFFVIATESSLGSEGTFPLPEVQKDRFLLTLTLGYPEKEEERWIMKRAAVDKIQRRGITDLHELKKLQELVLTVHVDDKLKNYMLSLIDITRQDSSLFMGVSPRGSLALLKSSQAMAALKGRDFVTPEDIQDVLYPVLNKRIILKSDAAGNLKGKKDFIDNLLSQSVPPID